MKLFFPAAIALTIAVALPARAQENNPLLEELRPQLQAALAQVAPDAIWQLKGNELMATYKTREFVIYPIAPTGAVAAQLEQEIGPDNGGFVLRVRVFSELPYFAAQTPSQTRRVHWRTFTARTNLRAEENATFQGDEPEITRAEWARVSNVRLEFTPVTPEMAAKFDRLVKAEIFKTKMGRIYPSQFYGTPEKPLARYDVASEIADLQDAMPELLENKATRIEALQAATATAEHKFSSAEIEALDSDIRDLQTEFQREIGKMEIPLSTGPAHGGLQPQKPRIIAAKVRYIVVTLANDSHANSIETSGITDKIKVFIQAKNKEIDDK